VLISILLLKSQLRVSDGIGRLIWGFSFGWLGVVVARQADLSGGLATTGRCASTAGRSSTI